MFWNLPNRNFNTFIAQFTFTSRDENWEALFIDIHVDRERSDWANPTPGRSPMSDTLQHVRNQRSHPPAPREPHEETSDKESNTAEETGPAVPPNLADIGVPIPGPPNYRTSETFHHEWNLRVPPLPETVIRVRLPTTRREVVEGPVQIVPPRALAYNLWAHYFQEHPEMRTNWQSRLRPLPSTRPIQVRPPPCPFTPHPEPKVVDVSSGDSTNGDCEMEEMPRGDTVPNTPERPTTPLEQMEEDDMRRLHPAFPSNADLIAAGDNSIQLTEEQHRILMSQSEGTTFLYNVPENRQRVEGSEPYLGIMNEERAVLTQAHDALHIGIGLEGTSAEEAPQRISDLIRPGDPPILMAFAQELENWPQLDQYLNETFEER